MTSTSELANVIQARLELDGEGVVHAPLKYEDRAYYGDASAGLKRVEVVFSFSMVASFQ